jgi:lipid-A-disaccharide synthase
MGLDVRGAVGATARNFYALARALRTGDILVAIDAPDVHLPFARWARSRGVRTVGYVCPQLWAWRPGRRDAVARAFDRLLCLWPFEPALFAGSGLEARFVGHPAADRVRPGSPEPGVLALFPGSRRQELARHLGPFLEAAARVGAREALLPLARTLRRADLGSLPANVRVCDSAEALARASLALSKSGTSTLELGLAGIPTVVAHRLGAASWALARRLVSLRRVALPNVLLGEDVMEEQLQDLDPAGLVERLRRAVPPPAERLRQMLRVGPADAAAAAAAAVLEGNPREAGG